MAKKPDTEANPKFRQDIQSWHNPEGGFGKPRKTRKEDQPTDDGKGNNNPDDASSDRTA